MPNQRHQSSTFKHCATSKYGYPSLDSQLQSIVSAWKDACVEEEENLQVKLWPWLLQLISWSAEEWDLIITIVLMQSWKCFEGILRAVKSILLYLGLVDEKGNRMTQTLRIFWMQAEECLPKIRLKNNSVNKMWPCFKVLIFKYISFWRWKKIKGFNANHMTISVAFFPGIGNGDRVTEWGKERGIFRKCIMDLSLKFEMLDISEKACTFNFGFYCCFNMVRVSCYLSVTLPLTCSVC